MPKNPKPKLTPEHLRYGSVSALSRLLSIEVSQISAWFGTDRKITQQNLQRIADSMNLSVDAVAQAIADRQNDRKRAKQINEEIQALTR